ncbi:MAG: hypothetical protein E7360_03455 [Clostridiales bacterium]|nr:hypothetical protein [Clostridiales bacterium]
MAVFYTDTYFDCIDAVTEKASKIGVGLRTKTIIFCEDKLTLSLEKALVSKTGGGFGCEVLSFGRYITRNMQNRKTLTKEGASMAVKKILSNCLGSLKTLSSLGSSPALATKTAELIAQLKSAKVTPQNLFDCIDGCPKNVGAKIHDIALIFQKYEEFLSEKGLTDSNNALEDMITLLNSDQNLASTNVLIAGYSSVTKQSCEVMKTLLKKAKSCDFYAVSGENLDLYTGEFLNFAVKLTGEEPIYIPSSKEKEADLILNRLFKAEDFEKVGLYSDKLQFFEANTPAEEVEYLARFIKKSVVEKGVKFTDIAVGVGNLLDYELLLERKFLDYGIPFFTDSKRTLSSHPLSNLVFSAIKCAIKKSGMDDVKRVITNSLFILEKDIADKMIRYITENSVTPSSFLSETPEFEGVDNLIISSKWSFLASFISSFPKKATAKEFTVAIEKFLSGSGISLENSSNGFVSDLAERLSLLGEEEQRSFLEGGIVKFGEVLNEISSILGEEILTADEFFKLLRSGTEACEISLIPEYYDCVYIGEIKNCRYKKYDYLYIIGLSGDIPPVKADTALLIDSEISKLESLSLSIEPKIRVVNRREKEATAIALCSFEKNLYLSYSLLSPQGTPIAKSDIIDYLLNAFSGENESAKVLTAEKIANNYEEYGDFPYLSIRPTLLALADEVAKSKNTGEKSFRSASYNALSVFEDGKYLPVAEKLIQKASGDEIFYLNLPYNNYFKDGRVSASTIETYYSCPYKCFLKYGVGINDSATADIQTRDVGNVMHDLAEQFIPFIDQLKTEEEVTEKAEQIFDLIFQKDDYKRFLKRPDYVYSAKLLKREGVKLCLGLFNEFKNSDFRPIGAETWFADWSDGPYKSYKLPTKKGNFKLFGKVDRIDKYKNYVRIIDYKTGKAENKIKDENFYTGQNVQLYLYMNAFAINGDKPSGAYYYSVNDNFHKEGENPVTMHGNTLNEREVLLATDKNFEKDKKSTVIKAKIKSTAVKGEFVDGSVADENKLTGYMNYAKKIASSAIDGVLDGVAVPSPYKGGCDYCEFGALCGFDSETGSCAREVKGVKSETIVNAGNKSDGEVK